jgi:hypothetical protein
MKTPTAARVIPTPIHGVLDYTVGTLIAIAPWLFGFAKRKPETIIPLLLGSGAFVYSLLTDYELGLFDVLTMRTHLMIDFASGILLASAPWLFGFAKRNWLPHLLLGILEIAAVLLTDPEPYKKRIFPGLQAGLKAAIA